MTLSPHLSFNGQCAEAFRFYEKTLGGRIAFMQTHAESPAKDHVAPEWGDKIIHARLELGGSQVLMGMDAPPPHYAKPQGIFVTVSLPTTADSERAFKALADGGQVTMPFQKTFWSSGFGMAVDRYGIPWMINTEEAR
jgi:PhnB protein